MSTKKNVKKKVVKQLIGIEVYKPGCGGIDLSYLIDGVQKKIHVGGTHYTDVSLVTGEDLNDLVELNDRELADDALVMVRSIADKWEEFTEDAIYERNHEANRRHLDAEQKVASTSREKVLEPTTAVGHDDLRERILSATANEL
jgi:hypothetical protein